LCLFVPEEWLKILFKRRYFATRVEKEPSPERAFAWESRCSTSPSMFIVETFPDSSDTNHGSFKSNDLYSSYEKAVKRTKQKLCTPPYLYRFTADVAQCFRNLSENFNFLGWNIVPYDSHVNRCGQILHFDACAGSI
jgi:hypothetical protein